MNVLGRADQLRTGRMPFVLATVVRVERPTSAKPGDRALVLPDGTLEGFVGGSCAESTVRLQSLRLLATGESTLLRITPTESAPTAGEGTVTVANPCLSGGTLDIFLEAMLPPVLVHVYGFGPVARALVDVGRALGYEVRDTSPDNVLPEDLGAVVVASHGRDEEAVLTAAVRAGVPYVGLVASRRRGAAVLAALDVPAAAVHTPAGLDIGSRTAGEIALSIYAELVAERPRGGLAELVEAVAERPRAESAELVAEQPRAESAELVAEQPREELAEAVDPVCGMAVAVSGQTLSLEVGGRIVYFCGSGCRDAFARSA